MHKSPETLVDRFTIAAKPNAMFLALGVLGLIAYLSKSMVQTWCGCTPSQGMHLLSSLGIMAAGFCTGLLVARYLPIWQELRRARPKDEDQSPL